MGDLELADVDGNFSQSAHRARNAQIGRRLVEAVSAFGRQPRRPRLFEAELVFRRKHASLDEATRYDIVNRLCSIDNDLARLALGNTLVGDPSSLVRHEAAFGLGYVGDASSERVLIFALEHDESFLVRHEAAMSLAEFGGPQVTRSLRAGLEDESAEVAISCEVALQRIMSKQDTETAAT